MISKEQKSNLAKLLATENLNVEHRKVKTAHFVPKTRTLCLPIWDNMSNDLYDLLCGHEVGHALWTPADDNKVKVKGLPHSYLNVIEDIRIDKKMKIKYPGLRKSYFNGYKELVARDFFGKFGDQANNMRFIDRLNIFTKSGNLENTIEFNDVEKAFIEKSNNLQTFDDVIALAKEIFAYSKEENYDKEKDPLYNQFKQKQEENKLDEEMEDDMPSQDGDSNEDPEGEEQEQNSSGDSEEEEDNKQEEEKGSGKSDGDGDDEKPENDRKEKTNTKSPEAGHNPDYLPEEITGKSNEALSDINYEEAIKNLSDMSEKTRDRLYVDLPEFIEEKGVVSSKRINDIYKQYYSKVYSSATSQNELKCSLDRFKKWKNSQSKTVSYMAKEFEMKKAADNYKKTLSSKTGIINMNKLHSYKYNDDIFKRIQVEPGAKNHGMMMFIDWSGSMALSIDDTIKQTINLAMFCKAVQIPFRVFAFSDLKRESFFSDDLDEVYYGRSWSHGKEMKPSPAFRHKHGNLFVENVQLIEWLSSEQKTPEYNENMLNLYRFGEYHTNDYRRHWSDEDYYSTISMPGCMRLGGTPLDPAIVGTIKLVKDFISKYKIQKMNTIYLTDGCGHSMYNTVTTNDNGELELDYKEDHSMIVIKDKQTRKNYKYESSRFNRSTKVMFDMLREKTGTNVIGFYITNRNQANYYDIANFLPENGNGYDAVETVRKQTRKEKVGTIVGNGYDELFIIPRKNLKITDGEADIKPEMTAAKMKSEFSKTLKTKKISRVLLNKFVERVA